MASLSAALALKDPAASLAAVKELALNDPTDAPTAVACADLHLRIGMARAAAKYCAAALSADATMVRAHMVHARTLAALGKPNKACTSARTALSLARDAADGARIGAAPARKHTVDARERAEAQLLEECSALESDLADNARKAKQAKRAKAKADEQAPAEAAASAVKPKPKPKPKPSSASASEPIVSQTTPAPTPAAPQQWPGHKPRGKSVWNRKDTWEEVDLSNWAVDNIAEKIEGVQVTLSVPHTSCPGSSEADDGRGEGEGGEGDTDAGSATAEQARVEVGWVRVTALRAATGYAQIVHFQGRVRFLFDLGFELTWLADITLPGAARRRLKGKFRYSDVAQDFCGTMHDVHVPAPASAKGGAEYAAIDACLRNRATRDVVCRRPPADDGSPGDVVGGLQTLINEQIAAFEKEFQALPEQGGLPPVSSQRSKRRAVAGSHGGGGGQRGDVDSDEDDGDIDARRKKAESDETMRQLMNDPRIKFS